MNREIMDKHQGAFLTGIAVMCFALCSVDSPVTAQSTLPNTAVHELSPIGTLPQLDAEWEVWPDDSRTKSIASQPFHWIVFRHQKSGDLLSLAARPPETEKLRGLEFWSDTALEIFPRGLPVWTTKHIEATNSVLAIKVVSSKGQDVLKYCFVSESPGQDNTMAHGCAWVCRKGIVFVQHTSARPITPEIQDS